MGLKYVHAWYLLHNQNILSLIRFDAGFHIFIHSSQHFKHFTMYAIIYYTCPYMTELLLSQML